MQNVDNYPLQWPAGWKRSKQQVSSRFGTWNKPVTIGAATSFVLGELELLGIPDCDVIISSNLRVRLDGLPYSNQANPTDVGISVWWSDGGKQKVIALDKYDRIADNLWAIGKTIEAMRGIERWGSGEILERTFEGFDALPNPDKTHWRDVLGYQGESRSECKAIYLRKMRESHPDNGGNDSAAAAINQAWEDAKQELQ